MSADNNSSVKLSLKELLGKWSYLSYIEKVVIPKLEEVAKSGGIQRQELDSIANEFVRNPYILTPEVNFLSHTTLNTLEADGYIAESLLNITDKAFIRNIIKRSSKKENFKKIIKFQKKIKQVFQGTKYESKIPKLQFVNKKNRITVTPYVTGVQLKQKLDKSSKPEKEKLLKTVIDDYIDLYTHLNREDIKYQLKIPGTFDDFNRYFSKKFIGDKYYTDLHHYFKQDIGDFLNSSANNVIHGDLHPNNILVNGGFIYLDWANVTSNSFFEFDLYKLLHKLDLDFETEESTVKYATKKLYNSSEKQNESFERFEKNKIMQDLVESKTYLEYAQKSKDKDQKQKLANMSNVIFNNVYRRMQRDVKKGIIKQVFLDQVVIQKLKTKNYTVEVLNNKDFDELKTNFNPYKSMIQENVKGSKTLLDLIKKDHDENPISKIKKSLKTHKRNYLLKAIGIPLLGLILISGAYFTATAFQKFMQKRDKHLSHLVEVSENIVHTFRNNFNHAYRMVLEDKAEGKNPFVSLRPTDKIVYEVAEKNNLNPKLLANMLKATRAYVGLDFIYATSKNHDVVLLDPLAAVCGFREQIYFYKWPNVNKPIINQIKNLEKGAKRLSDLISKKRSNSSITNISEEDVARYKTRAIDYADLDNDKDISETQIIDAIKEYKVTKFALRDFYMPPSDYDPFKWWDFELKEHREVLSKLNTDINNLSHTVLAGTFWSYDGGIASVNSRIAPPDF